MQKKSAISSAVHQMGGTEHQVWADPNCKTWDVRRNKEEVMLTGEITTLWYNTGVTFGCLEDVQHRICVLLLCACVCECPDSESVSFSYFWMTWLIVNHTLLSLEVLMCFFSVTQGKLMKIITVKKERVTIVPKNTKVFIHAGVLTLSVIRTHSHTLGRWNPTTTTLGAQSGLQPRLVMLERPPGGATMRWPDRRGTLSSICAPGKWRQNENNTWKAVWCIYVPFNTLETLDFQTSSCFVSVTWQAEVGLVKIANWWWLVRGGWGFGWRSRSDIFGGRDHIVHRAVVHTTSNTLLAFHLNRKHTETQTQSWANGNPPLTVTHMLTLLSDCGNNDRTLLHWFLYNIYIYL